VLCIGSYFSKSIIIVIYTSILGDIFGKPMSGYILLYYHSIRRIAIRPRTILQTERYSMLCVLFQYGCHRSSTSIKLGNKSKSSSGFSDSQWVDTYYLIIKDFGILEDILEFVDLIILCFNDR
jgi:hypothetical protein